MISLTSYANNIIQVDQVWPNQTPESTRRVTYVVGHDSRYNIFGLDLGLGTWTRARASQKGFGLLMKFYWFLGAKANNNTENM